MFKTYAKPPKGDAKVQELKLKKPHQLQEILDIVRFLLGELEKRASHELMDEAGEAEIVEQKGKLEQVKTVLEM